MSPTLTSTKTPKRQESEKLQPRVAIDPFFSAFELPFRRYMGDLLGRQWPEDGERMILPPLDLSEDENEYKVTLEIPGLPKDRIQIQFENGMLTVSGEKKTETEKKGRNWHRMERRFGSVHRAITLPSDVDTEHAVASFDDGVLTITLPKTEEAKPKTIKIR